MPVFQRPPFDIVLPLRKVEVCRCFTHVALHYRCDMFRPCTNLLSPLAAVRVDKEWLTTPVSRHEDQPTGIRAMTFTSLYSVEMHILCHAYFVLAPGDLYVHQRNIEKKGFRSLLEGEPVEFVMAKMADGKLEALNVTGPGGVEPQGQPTPAEREEMEEEEEERARAKAAALAKMEAERPKKPATAFVPRTVKRPAPKSTARPAVKKPAPSAPAPADGLASAAAAAAPAAPETAD